MAKTTKIHRHSPGKQNNHERPLDWAAERRPQQRAVKASRPAGELDAKPATFQRERRRPGGRPAGRKFISIDSISEPFTVQLTALALSAHIAINDLLGKHITLSAALSDGSTKRHTGLIFDAKMLESDGGFVRLQVTSGRARPCLLPFAIRREVLTLDANVLTKPLLGKRITLSAALSDGSSKKRTASSLTPNLWSPTAASSTCESPSSPGRRCSALAAKAASGRARAWSGARARSTFSPQAYAPGST